MLVGTGAHGKVYRVSDDGRWALVATVPAEQVTGVVATGPTSAALVTANPARVLGLDTAAAARGRFVSKAKDAQALSSWGRIAWEGEAPRGTGVGVETRAGNTATPDATWTDWTGPADRAAHPEKARLLQMRLTLTGAAGATPTVEAVSTAYLQRNLAPVIRSITVHAPGEAFQKPISASGEPEILGLDVDPLQRARRRRAPASRQAARRQLQSQALIFLGESWLPTLSVLP